MLISAALDTGSSSNACALAISGRRDDGIWIPLALRQWIPSPGLPLDLRLRVLPEAARAMRTWGATAWATDSYAIDQVKLVGYKYEIQTVPATSDQWQHWRHSLAVLSRGRCALGWSGDPELPSEEDLAALRSQLATVMRKPAGQGKWAITLPEIGGLHGDLAVAWARSLWLARAADDVPEAEEEAIDPADYGEACRTAGARGGDGMVPRAWR